MKCDTQSTTCRVPDIFRCDMCGQVSDSHMHARIRPPYYQQYIKLWKPTEHFYLCSGDCTVKLVKALCKCDLTHGLPYRVASAYPLGHLRGRSGKQYSCYQCGKRDAEEDMVVGDPFDSYHHTYRTEKKLFCRSSTCFRRYCYDRLVFYQTDVQECKVRRETLEFRNREIALGIPVVQQPEPDFYMQGYQVWRLRPLDKVWGFN